MNAADRHPIRPEWVYVLPGETAVAMGFATTLPVVYMHQAGCLWSVEDTRLGILSAEGVQRMVDRCLEADLPVLVFPKDEFLERARRRSHSNHPYARN